MSDPKPGEWRAYKRPMGGMGIGEIVMDDGELLISTPGLYPSRFIPVSKLRSLGPPLDPSKLIEFTSYTPEPSSFEDDGATRVCLDCERLKSCGTRRDRAGVAEVVLYCSRNIWDANDGAGTNMSRAATCEHFEPRDE